MADVAFGGAVGRAFRFGGDDLDLALRGRHLDPGESERAEPAAGLGRRLGRQLVVGTEGTAFRLSGSGWQAIQPIVPVEYLDVHGQPAHGIDVCGEFGSLHRLAGTSWQPVDLQRNDQLYGVDVAADGVVRVAGDAGTCLRVAQEEVLELEAPMQTHLAVRSFRGDAYWGNESGLFVETGDRFDPVEDTGIASDLRTDGEFLYVSGIDTAWRFDGRAWKTLTLVYDDGFRLV